MTHEFTILTVLWLKCTAMDGAVFISRLQFWIEKNAANDRHYHEGRYWTYNSLSCHWNDCSRSGHGGRLSALSSNLKDKGVLLTATLRQGQPMTAPCFTPSTRANYPFHRLVESRCHRLVTPP